MRSSGIVSRPPPLEICLHVETLPACLPLHLHHFRSNCPWGQKAFTGYLGEDKATWADYDACDLATKYVHSHSPSFILLYMGGLGIIA